MSTSTSTVDWNESKVEAKPDIATDTLTSALITINSDNVENIKSADFIDTEHFSMNDYETDNYIGIDYSHAITKSDHIGIDVSELDIQQFALYLVLFDDEPKVFSGTQHWDTESGGDGGGSMRVNVNKWTEIRFLEDGEYKIKYYWRGYMGGGSYGSYGNDKITRITITIHSGLEDSLLTIDETDHKERLILGYCRLFLSRRNEFASKTRISSYAQAHHENSMLVLPKLVSSSFKGLINSSFCSPSDYVINLNSTLSSTTLRPYPYYIEVEGDYVIISDNEVSTYERRYMENNENIDYISPHSGSLIGTEIKIAHIPANSVLMIEGNSCLISRIH